MAIQLKDLKQKKLGEVVREIEYEGKLKMTMRINDDKAFSNALAKVQAPSKGMTKDQLSRKNNDNDNISMGEAMLYIIGEYLIIDWDVEINGEVAPINGDNFIALCASIGTDDENIAFVNHISEVFAEITEEFKNQNTAVKKKRLRSTSGRK